MKFIIKIKILFIIIFISNACVRQNKTNEKNILNSQKTEFHSIDITKSIKEQKITNISSIAENIEYVQLETSSISLLGEIRDVVLTNDYIFIKHNYGALIAQFDRKGNFVRYLGKEGKGPREYTKAQEISIDEDKKLCYIQSRDKKILVFSFDGEYIRTINLNKSSVGIFHWSRDSLFIQFKEPIIGTEKYIFIETNAKSDTLQWINNYYYWKSKTFNEYSRIYTGRNVFYRLGKQLHFKSWYCDTVYSYDKSNKIIGKFYIDLKEHKLPDDLRPEIVGNNSIPVNYYWTAVKESSRYIFIQYSSYDPPPNQKTLIEGYVYYDKNSAISYSLGTNGRKTGFVNDIDGGPDFIPEYISDSLAFQFVNALDFKEHIESQSFLQSNPLNPQSKNILIRQMKGLKETDNQVLMVVKLKQ